VELDTAVDVDCRQNVSNTIYQCLCCLIVELYTVVDILTEDMMLAA